MADGEKPMKSANESPLSAVTDTLSKLPWNDLLLGFVTLDCARRLTDGVPALFGPSPNYFGTALDVLFVGYGIVELAKKAGILKDKDFYEELEGGEVRSFAYEAGQNALAGEVPFRTKVLHRASLDPAPALTPTPTLALALAPAPAPPLSLRRTLALSLARTVATRWPPSQAAASRTRTRTRTRTLTLLLLLTLTPTLTVTLGLALTVTMTLARRVLLGYRAAQPPAQKLGLGLAS